MLIIKVVGGLGNQLFAYALYCYLRGFGKNVKLDLSFYRSQNTDYADERQYCLEDYFHIHAKYTSKFEDVLLRGFSRLGWTQYVTYVDKGKDHEIEVKDLNWRILEGYWSTFLFANIQREKIVESLGLKTKYKNDATLAEIENCNSVCVHIRRGDFVRLGFSLDLAYYRTAIQYMKNAVERPVFYCFSDDIEYCKEQFGEEFKYMDGHSDLYDLCAMSRCKHNIVANSTFSTWAAWLNQNEDKIVIHPMKWHGKWSTETDARLWSEEWISIDE